MDDRTPVWLDTDIGSDIDDALCLAYLLAQPRCRLLGVSTVTGQPQERAMLADAVCRAAGRDEVPIWSGVESPLVISQGQFAAPQAEVLPRWEHRTDFRPHEAVDALRRCIHEHPGEVTLLTVGPLTNVAVLFREYPEVPGLLKQLVLMAGWFFEPEHGEWNACGDPHATDIVFCAPAPELRVHGLDVTMKCRMDAQECRERLRGGPLDVAADMAEVWFRRRDLITFHDPLAAACIFEPGLCTYRRGRVRVEMRDSSNLGSTSLEEAADGPHLVADSVGPDRFFEHYFCVLGNLHGGDASVPDPHGTPAGR